MKKMMFENGGCGLAAPQIGELIQLVTIDCDYSDKNDYDPYVLINPVIVEQSDHLVPFSEGCLSIPGISCEIERPDHVVVEAYDLDANLIRYELGRSVLRVPAARDRSPARQHHVRATQAHAEAQGSQGVPGRPGPRRSTGRDGVGLSVPGLPPISSRAQTFSLRCETARGTI